MIDPTALRILSVDDTPDDRALVRREAEAVFPGSILVEAGTREMFEAVMAECEFDLVVTDLELKWGNGREVFERVRAEDPGCPVVMFTDSGDEMTAVDLMKAGLDDYVVKSARQLARLRASMRIAVEAAKSRSTLTERERQLASALAHERTIVRELHHRVKNNLQTITGLLQLRARSIAGEAAVHLEEIAGRVRALGAVQARIYEAEALDRVDFAAALTDMTDDLVGVYGDRPVVLDRQIHGPLELDVSRAMPLGLLCYEILLNAFKHAWPGGRAGTLIVALQRWNEGAQIVIVDDGVGFDEEDVKMGLGTRLMRALAKEAHVQLGTSTAARKGVRVELLLA